ncbi:zeta toxin family protein [Candidatus Saccharibacteria bacterium]|nr:zeta toxin family protein [Candidatus Saccharibacteria bacterium]
MNEEGALKQVIDYMKSHWPSPVKSEWQVGLEEYSRILPKIIADFTSGATKSREFIRIAGLSGSGKTSQILPAVEAYAAKRRIKPILIAARRFVEYHPFVNEIKSYYGEENLRKNTDEFSTIMMFLVLNAITRQGYDIILDVTLLDPKVEQILLYMLRTNHYQPMLLMIATSPIVTEHFLGGRAWRHTKETEQEFIRATGRALDFYAKNAPDLHIILWSVYDKAPIYDGEIERALPIFADYSARTTLPGKDDDARRAAKIAYMESLAEQP